MPFNLIQKDWIPARRKSGRVEWIPPWRITDGGPNGQDPFLELAAPRPDFNGALIQFLIGLVQTLCPPEDDKQWRRSLKSPPSPEDLKTAFERELDAFNLDGPGPRFMQDLDELAAEKETPISALLIDEPGDNTLKENKDFFVKRGRVPGLCETCAAMALFTLQTNAPSGGQGHRTSLRGGGPLTTLVLGNTLWLTVWLNVLTQSGFKVLPGNVDLGTPSALFPWLGPTRTSENGRKTTPGDMRPEHVFWGMPRRIRLIINQAPQPGPCALCSRTEVRLISSYKAKPRGYNYTGPWLHPLTPHSWKDNEPFSVKGQTGALSYRYWLGLVQSASDGSRTPALVCRILIHNRQAILKSLLSPADKPSIWAFGYDMDNMKPRGWCEGIIHLVLVDDAVRDAFEAHTAALIAGAGKALGYTNLAVKSAWYSNPKGKNVPAVIGETFWLNTEPDFYNHLQKLKEVVETDPAPDSKAMIELKESWRRELQIEAERLFEQYSQTDEIENADPKRVAKAWNQLRRNLYSKNFRQILLF